MRAEDKHISPRVIHRLKQSLTRRSSKDHRMPVGQRIVFQITRYVVHQPNGVFFGVRLDHTQWGSRTLRQIIAQLQRVSCFITAVVANDRW